MENVSTDGSAIANEVPNTNTTDVGGVDKEEYAEKLYANRKKTEEWYVLVSDRPIHCERTFEAGDCEYSMQGAVYIGELTYLQYAAFRKAFETTYKGRYIASFRPKMPLPKEKELLLGVWLDNYDNLLDEQREVLDIAVRIANQVRTAEGCGGKNIADSARKRKKETKANSRDVLDGVTPSSTTCRIFPLFFSLGDRKSTLHLIQNYFLNCRGSVSPRC